MNRRTFLKTAMGAAALFRADLFAAALMRDGTPKTLVLGGGAFALGYALAHPAEAIILERGWRPTTAWSATLRRRGCQRRISVVS